MWKNIWWAALKYSIAFPWRTCLSNCYVMDRCYKLSDSLSKFTEVQSIQHCCKRNSDGSTSPCWASKLLQWEEKCVWGTNTSHSRAQTPARTGSQAWAEKKKKNARIQTHPREGYSKWTSQPSKALTSIRHAYTVWLPTDSESHLSARASAKQFQSEGNHFMHICIHSERACQTRWLASPLSLLVLFTAIVQIVKRFVLIEWLFLELMIYLRENSCRTGTHSWAPPPHKPPGKLRPVKAGQYDSQKALWLFLPQQRLLHIRQIATGGKRNH